MMSRALASGVALIALMTAGAVDAQSLGNLLRQAGQNALRERQMQQQNPQQQRQQQSPEPDAVFTPIDRGPAPAANYAVWRGCADTLSRAPSSRDGGLQAARRNLSDAVNPLAALADADKSLDQMETNREGWFKQLAPTDQELKNKAYRDAEAQRLMMGGHFTTAQAVIQRNQRLENEAAHNYQREEARQRISSIEAQEQAIVRDLNAGPERLDAYQAAWVAYETTLRNAQARLDASPAALDALPPLEREVLVLSQCASADGTDSDAVTAWTLSDKASVLVQPLTERVARAQSTSTTADGLSAAIAPYTGSRALNLNPKTAAVLAPAMALIKTIQGKELAVRQARETQLAAAEAAEQKRRAAIVAQQVRAANLYQGAPTASQILLVSDRLNSEAYGFETTGTPGELVRDSAIGELFRDQRQVSNVACRPGGAKSFTCDYDLSSHYTAGDTSTLAGFMGSLAVAMNSDSSAHWSYTFIHDGARWTSPQLREQIAEDKLRGEQAAEAARQSNDDQSAQWDRQQRQLQLNLDTQIQLNDLQNHRY